MNWVLGHVGVALQLECHAVVVNHALCAIGFAVCDGFLEIAVVDVYIAVRGQCHVIGFLQCTHLFDCTKFLPHFGFGIELL